MYLTNWSITHFYIIIMVRFTTFRHTCMYKDRNMVISYEEDIQHASMRHH